MYDLVIIGSGPAGLALGYHCARGGLSPRIVDAHCDRPWPNNYGVWVDEVDPLELDRPYRRTWERTDVILDDRRTRTLERGYGHIDNVRLKELFTRGILQGGGVLCRDNVATVTAAGGATVLGLESGAEMVAKLVVDASGHAGRFVRAAKRKARTIQVAYGVFIETDRHPFSPERAVLMDYRESPFRESAELRRLPSFLYVLPYSAELLFLQETNIGALPAVPLEVIRRKLAARMRHLGIVPRRQLADEVSVIPLDPPLPPRTQPILGFGGAAGMVHPATGYMLTQVLQLAPSVARHLADRLPGAGVGEVRQIVRGAWRVVWPRQRVATRSLHLLGMGTLRQLDSRQTQDFFDAFFGPAPQCRRQAAEAWKAPDRVAWQSFLSSLAPFPVTLTGFLGPFLRGSARFKLLLIGKMLAFLVALGRSVPFGKPGRLPLLAKLRVAAALRKDPLALFREAARRDEGLVRLPVPFRRVFQVNDVELLDHILVRNGKEYWRGEILGKMALVTGETLIVSRGETWKKIRALLQPDFATAKSAGLLGDVSAEADLLLGRWQERGAAGRIDLFDEAMELSLRILCRLVFGAELSARFPPLFDLVHRVWAGGIDFIFKAILIPPGIRFAPGARIEATRRALDQALGSLIEERRRIKAASPCLLDRWLAQGALTQEELLGASKTVILAGHDTVASALSWTIYEAARNPGIQERLHAEAREAAVGGAIPPEAMDRLVYSRCAVKEALRLYPPPVVFRSPVDSDRIGTHLVRKGDEFIIPAYVMNRDPVHWPDPLRFDPERFVASRVQGHRCAYLSFGLGPRNCVGMRFALEEVPLLVSSLLLRYRFEYVGDPGGPGEEMLGALQPRNGLQMQIRTWG